MRPEKRWKDTLKQWSIRLSSQGNDRGLCPSDSGPKVKPLIRGVAENFRLHHAGSAGDWDLENPSMKLIHVLDVSINHVILPAESPC